MSTPWRMVVVDDDSKVRVLLERAFRAPEFETHAFPTGAAALRRVAEIRPDCVVSDILMPDMDGEGLLRAVRTVPGLEHVPFIAVSAVRSEARIRTVLEAGANAFLLKPFPLRDLIEKVRSLLERPATARSGGEKTSDYTSPTRPVVAAPHTMSTAAIRRRPGAARFAPPPDAPIRRSPRRPAFRSAPPAAPRAAAPAPPPPAAPAPPEGPTTTTAPTSVRVAPMRIVVPTPPAERADVRRTELGPPDGGLGFGRFTRVDSRGRSFVVLTEAVAQPKFTVTTVITENGRPAAEDRVRAPPPAGPRGGRRHRPPAARPAARRHAAAARRPRSRPHAAPRGVVGPEPQRGGRRPGVGHVGRRAARRVGSRDGRDGPAAAPDP